MKKSRAASFLAALIVTFTLVLGSGALTAASQSGIKGEIAALEDKLAQAALAREQAQQAIDDAKSAKSDALADKQRIDAKLLALTHEIDAMNDLIVGIEADITAKNVEIASGELEHEKIYQTIRERMRILREDGNVNMLAVLLEADGLSEFFTALDRMTSVLDYDRKLLDDYNDSLAELNTAKEGLDAQHDVLMKAKEQLDLRKSELDSELKTATKLVTDAERDEQNAAATLAKVEAEEARANAEREAKLAELQKSTNSTYTGGKFKWPLPDKYSQITSPYGWRIHPVTKKQQFHNGIDISAPYGTEIYAVADGTVIEVSSNYADGNFVTISHGGGVASFYSHVSKFACKVGDKVKKGQVIAYVGSSGYTTGPHLNLNVYENNTSVDPMKYFN